MHYCSDSWFLIALFQKDPKAISLIENAKQRKDRIVIPITALAEISKRLLQLGMQKEDIMLFISQTEFSERVALAGLTKDIAWEAANIAHRFGIPLLDSFVAATAKICNVDAVLSADEHFLPLKRAKYLNLVSW